MEAQNKPDNPSSEYAQKEVDFLKNMEEGMKLEESENSNLPYLILILSRDSELGFKLCKSLQKQLGENARILRFHKPISLSKIKEVFAPDVVISDSTFMLQVEQEEAREDSARNSRNGFLFFLNKENSGFSTWLCTENRMKHIHDAWHELNGY